MKIKGILAGMLAMVCFLQVHGAKVTLNANGGKVTPTTVEVVQGGIYSLPDPTPPKTFDGWWTAKDGGVQVWNGDVVDLSVFANPKSPTLYAQWVRPHKITVAGGTLGGGTTTTNGLYRGDEVSVSIDDSKRRDRNGNLVNEFAYWSYTPAVADLGYGFDQFATNVFVSMPNADVRLTANYVNGFAAYLQCTYSVVGEDAQGDMPDGDFYWSVDNGKTLIPFGANGRGYPVKPGRVTVKFYDKTGNWRAADWTYKVENNGAEKGVIELHAKFAPVDNSTKVKMDMNGGSDSRDEFFANGAEYGNLGIPYRKDYIFAGWWTEKEGGEHITPDRIFDPDDFAWQKTPALYAHWMQMKKLTLKDDVVSAYWDLEGAEIDPEVYAEVLESFYSTHPDFEGKGYEELWGKGVLAVLPGARVKVEAFESTYGKNWDKLVFQNWTVTPSKANLGPDFRVTHNKVNFTMPNEDVSLQANYVDESTCEKLDGILYYQTIFLGYDGETGEGVHLRPPAGSVEWSVDNGKTWFKATMVDYAGGDSNFAGESAMLKAGTYTVAWRCTDPLWTVTAAQTSVVVTLGCHHSPLVASGVVYTPQVVVDVVAYDSEIGGYVIAPAAGSVALTPKDGMVPAGKSITLTAKAAKGYVFQGWGFAKYWPAGYSELYETAATWKLENESTYLSWYIDPVDRKLHVLAAFKALSDYKAEDVKFWIESEDAYVDNGSDELYARTGCETKYAVDCPDLAGPYTYKLGGKLPSGMKFDSKTGVVSGAPSKEGDATVTITVTDPAKHSKTLALNIHVGKMAGWLAGEYRAALSDEGILEMSVASAGKVSAKVITCYGTRSVSGMLSWEPDDEDVVNGEGYYWFEATETKDMEECWVDFYPDGTIEGYADSYLKSEGDYAGGDADGMRQDAEKLVGSPFVDKYYTFAFNAETRVQSGESVSWEESGYGYLTLKTDKKGVAKVTGQLPDGEKVSMSALVLPFADEDATKARLYVFASPSAYKKAGWFAATLILAPDGSVLLEDGATWTRWNDLLSDRYDLDCCSEDYALDTAMSGLGAEYSSAQSIADYYWNVSCGWDENVALEYRWKAQSDTYWDVEAARNFGGYLFNVAVRGDKKGAISLVEKSPAPWKFGDEWEYEVGKDGNLISDPSQLSISFSKATGIFTGKATAYFDYKMPDTGKAQHATAVLPYAGVLIDDGEGGYEGFGSAVYTCKSQRYKDKPFTEQVSLPVLLEKTE